MNENTQKYEIPYYFDVNAIEYTQEYRDALRDYLRVYEEQFDINIVFWDILWILSFL